jgi:SAM-dependent methyltransferase
MTVADLGAGTGYLEPYLSRAVGPQGHVLALDVEPSMVAYMRDRAAREGLANVEARQVAPDDPGLAAGSVDRIVIVDTWHHLPDRPSYSKKLAAALAPGGTVTIVDFTLVSKMGPPVAERVAADQAIDELGAAGLRGEIVPEALPEQYVVRALR